MRRLLLVSLLLLAGCQGLVGPRKRDTIPEKIDPPYLSIPEQQARARDRLAFPSSEQGMGMGPRTWMEMPEQQYGQLSH